MGSKPIQPRFVTIPGFLLPWHLVDQLPVISGMVPDRLCILADAAAAAVLAFSLDLARSGKVAPFAKWRYGAAIATGLAVIALLPLVPAPYNIGQVSPVPHGWRATFAALHVSPADRVLLAPYPYGATSQVLRWQADTKEPAHHDRRMFIAPGEPGRLARAGRSGMTPTSYYIDYLWGSYPAGVPSAARINYDLAIWKPSAVVAVTMPGTRLGRFLIRIFGQPTTRIGAVLGWRLARP